MKRTPHKSITIPEYIYEDIRTFLEKNEDQLRRRHIRKISHLVVEAWYQFKENNKGAFNIE